MRCSFTAVISCHWPFPHIHSLASIGLLMVLFFFYFCEIRSQMILYTSTYILGQNNILFIVCVWQRKNYYRSTNTICNHKEHRFVEVLYGTFLFSKLSSPCLFLNVSSAEYRLFKCLFYVSLCRKKWNDALKKINKKKNKLPTWAYNKN